MPERESGIFIHNLAGILGDDPLREKWLIAPSNRIGYQWLDRIARSGQMVFNTHIKTIPALALEIAAGLMEKKGVRFANAERSRFIVAGLLEPSMEEPGSYFGGLRKNWRFVRAIHRALSDIRMSGLSSAELRASSFEVEAKKREITVMLEGYEEALASSGLVDYADSLKLATCSLESSPESVPGDLLVVMPGDLIKDLRGLEARLAELLLKHGAVIGLGETTEGAAADLTDAELMRFVLEPGRAPEPARDGTASIFRAVGEINEVREVFRRCVRDGTPLDDVEILYTDAATYVPLVYEEALSLSGGDFALMPASFYDGIPVMYSRPGRALAAFISWIFEGFPQEAAARMIQEGLLELGVKDPVFSRYAAMLRTLPIGEGLPRYKSALKKKIEYLRSKKAADGDEDNGFEAAAAGSGDWVVLLGLFERLSAGAELFRKGGAGRLDASLELLNEIARTASEFDEYSRLRLDNSIKALVEIGGAGINPEGMDLTEWLLELLRTATVEGKGPRPGSLYAAPLHAGGHSGRGHTFIIGLDDSRFPGQGIQDPVLLDSERKSLSPEMKHYGARPSENMEEFARTVSRVTGEIRLGYCCRKLDDDRKLFPGPAVLAAYRVISGDREGDLEDLERWQGEPASFAPASVEECLNSGDCWLNLACSDAAVEEPEKLVDSVYPHLGRGYAARDARDSDEFTGYDGYVPEAAEECGFSGGLSEPVSPTRLETLGKCPMEYFFKYILGVEVPDVYEHDTTRWLDPAETGSLLHEVFREFVQLLIDEESLPDFNRDYPRLLHVLGLWIEKAKDEKPPQRIDVYEREVADLELACAIFLKEEEVLRDRSTPVWCEASIGLPAGGEGTGLDSGEPVEIGLPGGGTISVRGRIDRVDKLAGQDNAYAVFDYKTGSDYNYNEADPHRKGRLIQNSLYMELAEHRLKSLEPGARAELFGYFFPNRRAHGERYEWSREELSRGLEYVELLCRILEQGCFTPSEDKDDMKYSDYIEAFGDINTAAENTVRKMANPDNSALESFRKLRE